MILTMMAAAAAVLQPQTVLTIDPKHRLVEGVASDGTTIWVSSVLDRTILACTKSCRRLAQLPRGLHPLGIAWDSTRKRLWIAADCPKLPGVEACERGALVALDRTGALRTRIGPPPGAFHPGDVSADEAGVFVSDSQSGAVYRVGPSGQTLTPIIRAGVAKSAQGSALDAAGERLIVADYSHGIATVDRKSGARTLLLRQDGKPLRGIDGLVRCGSVFAGVYNGSAPGSLVTIAIQPEGLEHAELIEGLQLPDPTQIAFDGNRLLVIADAGWGAAAKAGGTRSEGAPILAIPVDADCKPI